LKAADAISLEGHSLYPQFRQWSMKRAVNKPQLGHSTDRLGLATST
jgi:hypothetical protein